MADIGIDLQGMLRDPDRRRTVMVAGAIGGVIGLVVLLTRRSQPSVQVPTAGIIETGPGAGSLQEAGAGSDTAAITDTLTAGLTAISDMIAGSMQAQQQTLDSLVDALSAGSWSVGYAVAPDTQLASWYPAGASVWSDGMDYSYAYDAAYQPAPMISDVTKGSGSTIMRGAFGTLANFTTSDKRPSADPLATINTATGWYRESRASSSKTIRQTAANSTKASPSQKWQAPGWVAPFTNITNQQQQPKSVGSSQRWQAPGWVAPFTNITNQQPKSVSSSQQSGVSNPSAPSKTAVPAKSPDKTVAKTPVLTSTRSRRER